MIAGIAVKEGINAWRGNLCCPPPGAGAADTTTDGCARCTEHQH
jgi:hypothetical protein